MRTEGVEGEKEIEMSIGVPSQPHTFWDIWGYSLSILLPEGDIGYLQGAVWLPVVLGVSEDV